MRQWQFLQKSFLIKDLNIFWWQNKIIETLKKAKNRSDSSKYDYYPINPT
jgi:hypothetical protein